jgi:hypothetical protein
MAGLSNAAMAAGADSKVPTLTQVLDASGVNLSGFIDTSAIYDKNGSTAFVDSNNATTGTASRAYDQAVNSFNVQMMELALSKAPTQGWGGALVLNAGPDANVDHSYPMSTSSYFDIQQAYVSYQSGGAKLEVGKFATLIGAEVIESPDNWNFSRSWGFELGPYTHTGVRLSYALNDKVGFTIGANEGWDNMSTNGVAPKSAEAQITYKPTDSSYLSVQATGGHEVANGLYSGVTPGATNALYGTRSIINTVDSWDITNKVSVMIDASYAEQKGANSLAANAPTGLQTVKWWYVIPYLNYHINDQWRVALRAQYFDDKDGFRTGVAQKLKAGTITLAYMPDASAEVRAEVRYDKSNVKSFQSIYGTGAAKNHQLESALEFIYKM